MAEGPLKLRGDPRSPRLVLILMVAAIFVTWAIGVIGGLAQRSDTLRRAEDDVFRMNQIIAEQTGSLFQEVRVSLQLLDSWIRDNPRADPRTDAQFIHLVENLRKEARTRIDVRLISETDGLFFIPSTDTTVPGSEVGDLEYVKVQKEPATRGYSIAGPIRNRELRVWGIPVSYPLTKHNAGMSIIVAIIDLPHRNQLYETIRPRPDGAITLLRKDGTILDRVPFDFRVMGASVARTSRRSPIVRLRDRPPGRGCFHPLDSRSAAGGERFYSDTRRARSVEREDACLGCRARHRDRCASPPRYASARRLADARCLGEGSQDAQRGNQAWRRGAHKSARNVPGDHGQQQ